MALSIKNPETERLARELAEVTGSTVTAALTAALEARLGEVRARGREQDVSLQALRRLSADAGPRWPEHLRGVDHGDLLYDEDGLPR